MGLALIGAEGVEGAVTALETGAATTAIIAEADLFERADARLVERLLAAAEQVIVLDSHTTRLTERATIALPVADWAEAAGTVVNHEGRAQRRFAAYPAAPPAAWRVIAGLSDRMPDWQGLDDVLAALATVLPHLAPARDAAPDATFRTPLGAVARAGWRQAGRTAHDQAGGIVRSAPQPDADSALTFSMEGGQGADAPPALRANYAVPGLHSASAAPYLTDADRGALQDGDPGVSVLDGVTGPDTAPRTEITGEGLIPLPLHDPFAGDEVGRRAEYLAQRIPAAMVVLHPEDARRLSLAEGAALSLDGTPIDARLTISDAMPEGHVGLPAARVAPRNLHRRVRVEGQT